MIDIQILNSKICASQSQDNDLSTLTYFITHDVAPVADEIKNFQPRMRRYLWQFSRFIIKGEVQSRITIISKERVKFFP